MFAHISHIMTAQECAQILKVGMNTLLEPIHNGELDAFRVGCHWKNTKDAVIEFISHR